MKRVLIIEDEPILREALAEGLRSPHWQTDTAGTAREARALFDSTHPDLAVLDIKLPDDSGITLAREFAQAAPRLKIIVLTAYEAFRSDYEVWAAGLTEYIIKPVDLAYLRARISTLLLGL